MKNSSEEGLSQRLEEKIDNLDNSFKKYIEKESNEMFKLLEKHEDLENKISEEQIKITNLLLGEQQANRPNRLNNTLVALVVIMLTVTATFIGSGFLIYKQFKTFYREQISGFEKAMTEKDGSLTQMSMEFESYFIKSKEVINQLQNELSSLRKK